MEWMRIYHTLITGMAEWWRSETNTFQFPTEEATVTLEDVVYICSLPINSPVVTGRTFLNHNVAQVCEELLERVPWPMLDFNRISIKLTWLEQHFWPSEEDRKKEEKKLTTLQEVYNTRAYFLFLVLGQILSNASGSRGPAYLLESFREFSP